MSTRFVAMLLIILLIPFFVAEPLINSVFNARDVKVFGVSFVGQQVHTFLGIAIVICEIAIVLFSMLGRMRDTLDDILRPFLRFAPLYAFFEVFRRSFRPILTRYFPFLFGSPEQEASIAQAVSSNAFTEGVLLSVGALILFIITNNFLSKWRRSVRFIEEQ